MARITAVVCFVVASFAVSQQASAQYYVPNFVYKVPYQSPVIYYQAPVVRYDYYPRAYRYYPREYYYQRGNVINIYGYRRRVPRVNVQVTQPSGPRLETNHPSHYFGDPHASQHFP